MAILIDLNEEDTPFRVPLKDCYLRVTNAVPDLGNETVTLNVAVWLSKESRKQGGSSLPVNALLDIRATNQKQEKRLEIPRDKNGNILFNATVNGKPAVVPQEFPEIPAFADVLEQIVKKLSEGTDNYKEVGYELVKSLPFVQERNPRDDK